VKNLPDDGVGAIFEGEKEKVEEIINGLEKVCLEFLLII
jgi:acylphosphatase